MWIQNLGHQNQSQNFEDKKFWIWSYLNLKILKSTKFKQEKQKFRTPNKFYKFTIIIKNPELENI